MSGYDSHISMVRGYDVKTGSQLWQRTVKETNSEGQILQKACEVDCTLPCDLVAAGIFGAINTTTGSTAYNLSDVPRHLAMADGVAYSVQQATGTGRAPAGGRSYSSAVNGPGDLVATACGGGVYPGAPADVLWSADLPVGDGGSAPWERAIVVALSQDADAAAAPIVLLGGHQQGQCFRGHCQPSHSAAAAIHAPPGIVPPPIPPAPPAPGPRPLPSPCDDGMMSSCAKARAVSADKCEVCCGENARSLQKVGCKEADFEVFCHTATCNPKAESPEICKKSGVTCPQCGSTRGLCPDMTAISQWSAGMM